MHKLISALKLVKKTCYTLTFWLVELLSQLEMQNMTTECSNTINYRNGNNICTPTTAWHFHKTRSVQIDRPTDWRTTIFTSIIICLFVRGKIERSVFFLDLNCLFSEEESPQWIQFWCCLSIFTSLKIRKYCFTDLVSFDDNLPNIANNFICQPEFFPLSV